MSQISKTVKRYLLLETLLESRNIYTAYNNIVKTEDSSVGCSI